MYNYIYFPLLSYYSNNYFILLNYVISDKFVKAYSALDI